MKRKRLFSIIAVVLIIAFIALYLTTHPHQLSSLRYISVYQVVYLLGLRFLFLATNGLFLQAFAAKFDVRLMFKEWLGIPIITTMTNYITPFSGGMVARAVYLKHRHTFPYAQFATLLFSNYLVNFWVIGLVGLVASLTLANSVRFSWQISALFFGVLAGISILVLLPTVKLPGGNRLSAGVNTALEGWLLVKQDQRLLTRLVVYSLFNILLNGLSFWVAYQALGVKVSFAAALLIGLLAVFSILLNITPGNFGVQEAIVSFSSALLGAGTGEGLLASLLIRAATMIIAFVLGPVFTYLLSEELDQNQQQIH